MNAASARFRAAGLPVYVIRDLSDGTDERFANVRELHTEPSDIEITKLHNNSFWQTGLDAMLKQSGVDWVLLCGNAAEFCVTATYFGAKERGYDPHILQGGVLAETDGGIEAMETVRPMLSLSDLALL